ncbi:MAG: TonB family protein [Bacteroidales bacterium]|nr:TonB family protein [Bacteroidales bacterium]
MFRKSAITLVILFCAAALVAAQNFNVEPALRRHVAYLCAEELQGRQAGSPGESLAADYIYRALRDAGLQMLCDESGQDFSIADSTATLHSCNIVGIVEGYDRRLRNEYIVVGAHMDGMGALSVTVNGRRQTRIYPGADDNASGVATLIELSRLVAANSWMFPRSVVFAAFGAGECGTAGSWYFVNRAFTEIGSVRTMVNLDMLGRGNAQYPFTVYSSLPKQKVDTLLSRTLERQPAVRPVPFNGTLQTSDHLPFYQREIPVFLFTTGKTREYRTVSDTPELVLYKNMERQCNYLFNFLLTVASAPAAQLENRQAAPSGETLYPAADCDVRPQFFHADERHFLKSWVYKYLRYPQEAVSEGIQGRVSVGFVVEKDGSVSNVEVVTGVDPLLDAEAVRVVSVSPKWIPGKIAGRPVRTRLVLPIEFRLTR